jgi:hypothetical protein
MKIFADHEYMKAVQILARRNKRVKTYLLTTQDVMDVLRILSPTKTAPTPVSGGGCASSEDTIGVTSKPKVSKSKRATANPISNYFETEAEDDDDADFDRDLATFDAEVAARQAHTH